MTEQKDTVLAHDGKVFSDLDSMVPEQTFQSPNRSREQRSPSPSFGSSPIRGSLSYTGAHPESPSSSFSTNLRTWIGDNDMNNYLESSSIHQHRYKDQDVQHLADTVARIENDMEAQLNALSVKVNQWRSKDQKDMFRDRELILDGMRSTSGKINSVQKKQSELESKLLGIQNQLEGGTTATHDRKVDEVSSAVTAKIKSALETFEAHGQSMEKLKEKVNSIGEKEHAMNLEVGRVQDTIETAITSLQNQIHQILHSQQAIMKEMRIRGQNEQLLKEEIKRLEMLFTELSNSQQITGQTTKIFMDEIIDWRKKIDEHHELFDQNISNMSVSYNRLRSRANREKIYDDRSFRHLNTSVSICEEEIRKLKKQLTLAVRMFRKRGENIVMEMQ